ncbi:DNA topoisomerase 3 [Veillonella sp. CHU732]|uniref:DNA topoisomerase 3 n=1 Tax=Veillonella sp. CHU732 TaxID=2490949 RepID=UPI000F8F42DE|nr:DNA topoisomerase 3 [Veillonella sp. CHU732]
MRLFIAEKPSVGRELSQVLPNPQSAKRHDGYIVQGDDVITWAFGHMLEQVEPGDYDEKYKFWRFESLPILPISWKLKVKSSSAKQFKVISGLIKKATTIVNAGDPDREGQLLIDEMLDYLGNTKPVERILLNALDEKSMRYALEHMQDNKKYQPLKDSALARSRADWLMGMNLSRAYTLEQQHLGNKVTFPIGRVKTPTLALVVRRERELQNFVPVEYYVLQVQYGHEKGAFWATWKPKDTQQGLDPDGHMLDQTILNDLRDRLMQSPEGTVSLVEKKKKKEGQRLPFSLSSLQIVAGKLYNYTPQEVLDIAQKLYEKKYTSYPRSDCEYLPVNQLSDGKAILSNLVNMGHKELAAWAKDSNPAIKSRAWNDSKVTAHHAIIPTTVRCPLHTLSKGEQNIYFLIAQAYIAQFYPEHVYEHTRIEVMHQEELFTTTGRVVIDLGWKALYKKVKSTEESEENQEDEEKSLPPVRKGDAVTAKNCKVDQRKTKPPSRFTSATLVQAMKEIHKYVKDEELKKQLKDVSGIGTEATRATIIDDLIHNKKNPFLKEEGKKKILIPTESAYTLVDALPDSLLYPDATAQWEERLAKMSEGTERIDVFLEDQTKFVVQLIEDVKRRVGNTAKIVMPKSETGGKRTGPNRNPSIAQQTGRSCPKCKTGELLLRKGKFGEFYGCSEFPTCKYTENVSGARESRVTKANTSPTAKVSMPQGSREEIMPPIPLSDGKVLDDTHKEYTCPRCKKGYLIQYKSQTEPVWKCSEGQACRTTCADVEGKPAIYANRK